MIKKFLNNKKHESKRKNNKKSSSKFSLKNFSIRVKILGAFGLIVFLLLIGAGFSYLQMNEIRSEMTTYSEQSERAVIATDIGSIIRSKYIIVQEAVQNREDTYTAYYHQQDELLQSHMNHLDGRLYSQHSLQLFRQINSQLTEFDEKVTQISDTMGPAQVRMLGELAELRHEIIQDALELSEVILAEANEAQASAESVIDFNVITLLAMIGLIIVTGLVLFTFLANMISNSLRRVVKTTEEVSKGNLAVAKLESGSKDEIGRMSEAINDMVENLRRMITQISHTSEQVAASSEQMLASSNETSKATEEITQSIQEVSSGAEKQVEKATENEQTVNEMSQSIDQISSSIQEVNEASIDSAQKAEHGTEVIHSTVGQMKTIHSLTEKIDTSVNELAVQSNKIGSIVSLITEVAEQTNLLALNAAIEAARAGEHGRGFAVVADEVRKLAEQTSNATSDISDIIEKIQEDVKESVVYTNDGRKAVESGLNYVDEAGKSFEDLSQAIHGVSTKIQGVTAAIQQIDAGAEGVFESLKETTSIAQQSAGYTQNVAASAEEQNASMEEVSTSSTQLAKMAEELQEVVNEFKTS
ncbi:methyl-accepting chemotaxis protein [Bacillus shivajii]|nr:methyl-accepting chemotaxis protein [Bacillus shivajii]UCZ52400.1 methyl-accepting chemotaxis protein [Bacillus shivajii]